MEKIEEISLLLDLYIELLPEKQREFLRLYHEDNLSLAEIAESYGVSRQGVHDGVKKAESALRVYEEKLGLLADYKENVKTVEKIEKELETLKEERKGDTVLAACLDGIKEDIAKLRI